MWLIDNGTQTNILLLVRGHGLTVVCLVRIPMAASFSLILCPIQRHPPLHLHPLKIHLADLSQLGWPIQTSSHMNQLPEEYSRLVHGGPYVMKDHVLVGLAVRHLKPSILHTGDRPLFTDPVLVEYIVVPCPMYQYFSGQEQVESFQIVPNHVISTFQLSTLWKYCGNI